MPGFQAWLDIFPSLDLTDIILANLECPAARGVAWLVWTALTVVTAPPAP